MTEAHPTMQKENRYAQALPAKRKAILFAVFALFVILMGLNACNSAPQAPASTGMPRNFCHYKGARCTKQHPR